MRDAIVAYIKQCESSKNHNLHQNSSDKMTKLTIVLGLALVACILQITESRGFTKFFEGNDKANDDESGLERYRRSFANPCTGLNATLAAAGNALVIIQFTSPWCGLCKTIEREWVALAAQNPGCIFVKVDVDECEDISQKYRIKVMPTFVSIKDGEVAMRTSHFPGIKRIIETYGN